TTTPSCAATGSLMSNRRGMKSGPVTPTVFIADRSPCCVRSVPFSVKQLSIESIAGSTIQQSADMSTAQKTRWLDAQEQQIWEQLSTMILRLQPVLNAQLQREFGISHFEYLMMARLSEAPESKLRMSVLATITGSSLPRLSQAVSRLEKRGWMS